MHAAVRGPLSPLPASHVACRGRAREPACPVQPVINVHVTLHHHLVYILVTAPAAQPDIWPLVITFSFVVVTGLRAL